jgi:hypothetical protein
MHKLSFNYYGSLYDIKTPHEETRQLIRFFYFYTEKFDEKKTARNFKMAILTRVKKRRGDRKFK